MEFAGFGEIATSVMMFLVPVVFYLVLACVGVSLADARDSGE